MAVRGPTGLTYWRRPAKQHSDVQFGWSLQDDLIRFGNDGLADYLVRTDFMISTAGHKIAPVEVETALSSHPAVREAVVFGLPDATRRETVAAFVVLNQGFAESDGLRRELQAYVKSRLAPYKYPRRLDFIDAIPRDSVGKVQPRILRGSSWPRTPTTARTADDHATRSGYGPYLAPRPALRAGRRRARGGPGAQLVPEPAGLDVPGAGAGRGRPYRHHAVGAGVICSAADYRRARALISIAIPSAATAPYDRMPGAIMTDWPRFAARSAQAIVLPETSAETRDWLSRMFGATRLGSALAGLAILRSFEPRDLVKRWDVPAYFVHGSGDPIVPAAISKECADRFGGQYLEVPSAAHLVVIDQKEAVHRIVADVAGGG